MKRPTVTFKRRNGKGWSVNIKGRKPVHIVKGLMLETMAYVFFLHRAEVRGPKTPPLGMLSDHAVTAITLRVHPRALREFENWIVRQPRRRK